jgi:hypothetical protein
MFRSFNPNTAPRLGAFFIDRGSNGSVRSCGNRGSFAHSYPNSGPFHPSERRGGVERRQLKLKGVAGGD